MITTAPYLCAFKVGDRVLSDSSVIHMDAVGTVVETWFVPSNRPDCLGHWRVKVQAFSGNKLHTWEAQQACFRPAVKTEFKIELELEFDDHNPHLIPPNRIWIEWAFMAMQRSRGYEPWHNKQFFIGTCPIIKCYCDRDNIYYLHFAEGVMQVFTDQLLVRYE